MAIGRELPTRTHRLINQPHLGGELATLGISWAPSGACSQQGSDREITVTVRLKLSSPLPRF